jgi:hypothetical protein
MLRLLVAFCLFGCFSHSICQNTPDPATYSSFFRQVAQKTTSYSTLLNRQVEGPSQSTVRNAIGLTEQESQVLNAIASDCNAKVDSFDAAMDRMVFDGRLRLIDSETSPADAARARRQLKVMDGQRRQIALAHIQQLRAAFGELRFDVLDAWVRSRQQADSFFPLVTSDGASQKKN